MMGGSKAKLKVVRTGRINYPTHPPSSSGAQPTFWSVVVSRSCSPSAMNAIVAPVHHIAVDIFHSFRTNCLFLLFFRRNFTFYIIALNWSSLSKVQLIPVGNVERGKKDRWSLLVG